mgnify:CR=1 FL=1
MTKLFKIFLITCVFSLFITGFAFGETLFSDDLDWSGSDFQGSGGWQYVTFEKLSSGGVNNSGCMRAYGKGNGAYIDIEGLGNHLELYIRFYAKVSENSNGGTKWLKVFGQGNGGSTYANTTFIRRYFSGIFDHIEYGEGGGDNSHKLQYNLNGTEPNDDWHPPTTWTCYEYHIKFAQAPEWNNGVVEVWIDGVKYAEHYNVNNRSTAQEGLYIDELNFAGYSQDTDSDIGWRYIDEVVVATERIGMLNKQPTAELGTPLDLSVSPAN